MPASVTTGSGQAKPVPLALLAASISSKNLGMCVRACVHACVRVCARVYILSSSMVTLQMRHNNIILSDTFQNAHYIILFTHCTSPLPPSSIQVYKSLWYETKHTFAASNFGLSRLLEDAAVPSKWGGGVEKQIDRGRGEDGWRGCVLIIGKW